MTLPKRLIVGITGASGAIYAQRLVRLLVASNIETHLVVTPLGQRLLHDELGMDGIDIQTLAGTNANVNVNVNANANVNADTNTNANPDINTDTDHKTGQVHLHNYRDVGASIASGSFLHDGMIVMPCSSNTLSAIAIGSAQNLLHRAAHVTLKERRRLVLVPRETPLSLIDIRNMQAVTEAGAIVCPANPGFYLMPKTIDDLVDFVVGRVLDLVDVPHELNVRWTEPKT